ncbi:MAG: hypothetical protein R2788_04085 [Saprospiraceae bacterium]
MDLNGKAGLANANPALTKEFRGKKIGYADFLPEFFGQRWQLCCHRRPKM